MNTKGKGTERRKPDGGYCFISGTALLTAWWTYRRGFIRLYDVRVWIAAFELVARRRGAQKRGLVRYTTEELHRLVGGVGGEHLRRSLGRLESQGLLRFSETAIDHTVRADLALEGFVSADAIAWLANARKRVPVPRRLLRFLARGASRATIATALGHVLRCLYYRKGSISSAGTCKASLISGLFGIDARSVKRARAQLTVLGLLTRHGSHQCRMNRVGAHVSVNLAWAEPRSLSRLRACGLAGRRAGREGRPQTDLSPPKRLSTTRLSPPIQYKKLSSRSENQKPVSGRPAGVEGEGSRKNRSAPDLRWVRAEDLLRPARTLALHAQAVSRGLIGSAPAERLNFLAAAAHAKRVGKRNPQGLFAWLIAHRKWEYLTDADESEAMQLIRIARTAALTEPKRLISICNEVAAERSLPGKAGGPRAVNRAPAYV